MSPVSCNWCLSEEYNQSEDWHRDLLHLPSFSRPCHGFKNNVFINMMFQLVPIHGSKGKAVLSINR